MRDDLTFRDGSPMMTATDFRVVCARLNISRTHLWTILDLHQSTPSRWAGGAVRIPTSVALLLALICAGDVTLERLNELREAPEPWDGQ